MRRALLVLAIAAVAAGLLAAPAAGQAGTTYPSGAITGNHGRAVYTIYHPFNRSWFVEVGVDVHFGYNTAGADPDAEFASPVGRITKGSGALRVQHEGTHLGYESGQGIVRDFNPILGQPRNRQNGLGPIDPINSGEANQVLASQDWRRLRCTDDRVAARFYFSIRWADNSVTTTSSRRSNFVEHDLNGCVTDLSVEKFASEGTTDKTTYRPGDVFAYQVNVTNPSLDAAPGTVWTDTLPAGVALTGSLEAGCSYNATTRQVTCDIGTLRARAVSIRVFEVTVGANVTAAELVNSVVVRTAASDPNPANNSDTFTLTLAPPPPTTTTTLAPA